MKHPPSWVLRKRSLRGALAALDAEFFHMRTTVKVYNKGRTKTQELLYLNRVRVIIREMQKSADHAMIIVDQAMDMLIQEGTEDERTE